MENIIGTWALLRTEAVDANGKPTSVAPFGGTNFIGRVVFTKGAVCPPLLPMHAIKYQREKQENIRVTLALILSKKNINTTVDACSDPARMGTQQIRTVSFEKFLMILQPPLRSYETNPQNSHTMVEKISDI